MLAKLEQPARKITTQRNVLKLRFSRVIFGQHVLKAYMLSNTKNKKENTEELHILDGKGTTEPTGVR